MHHDGVLGCLLPDLVVQLHNHQHDFVLGYMLRNQELETWARG